MSVCMDGWMGGWVDGWMDASMDGWMDKYTHTLTLPTHTLACSNWSYRIGMWSVPGVQKTITFYLRERRSVELGKLPADAQSQRLI